MSVCPILLSFKTHPLFSCQPVITPGVLLVSLNPMLFSFERSNLGPAEFAASDTLTNPLLLIELSLFDPSRQGRIGKNETSRYQCDDYYDTNFPHLTRSL